MEIHDMGKHNTTFSVSGRVSFLLPKQSWKVYLEDARRALDRASRDINPIGINAFMGALMLLYEEGYNGRHNHRPDIKDTDMDIEYGVTEAKIAAHILNAGIRNQQEAIA